MQVKPTEGGTFCCEGGIASQLVTMEMIVDSFRIERRLFHRLEGGTATMRCEGRIDSQIERVETVS